MSGLRHILMLSCCALVFSFAAKAQFVPSGSEPAGTVWMSMPTRHFNVVFPRGCDSLARIYANKLEWAWEPVGGSIGLNPLGPRGKRLPVVLHPNLTYSNGSVAWAPGRMELYTTPETYSPMGLPWSTLLCIHESRHVAQMQTGASKGYRLGNLLLGELTPSAVVGGYMGSSWLEGDAVMAETALTSSGRGRSSDFLEYYRTSFAEGKMRNYYQWRYGRFAEFNPDHYTIGYLTNAGMRAVYDSPDFNQRYIERIRHHKLFPFNKTVREVSGKRFRKAWREVADSLAQIWAYEEFDRSPFMESEPLTSPGRYYGEYSSLVKAGGSIYAIRQSIVSAPMLVKIEKDGTVREIHSFSSYTSDLAYDSALRRIMWSEYVPDVRWEMKSTNTIWAYDTRSGRVEAVAKGVRWFNPSPMAGCGTFSVTECTPEGQSNVLVVSSAGGRVEESFAAPDGMQIVQTASILGHIYASTVEDGGHGICAIGKDGSFRHILPPQQCSISHLRAQEDSLSFVCDRSGVSEYYKLDPVSGDLFQYTNSANGCNQAVELDSELYFTSPGLKGKEIFKTSDIRPVSVDYCDIHSYGIADRLSEMEPRKLAEAFPDSAYTAKRYHSGPGRVHSWAPLWVDVDEVASISFEEVVSGAAPGLTMFFQNDLGNSYGSLGYSADLSGKDTTAIRHGLHARYTYSGLYPVFSLTANVYTDSCATYRFGQVKPGEYGLGKSYSQGPCFDASATVYVPFNFSRHGRYRGLIPQLSVSATNNGYFANGTSSVLNRAVASVRAYSVEATPSSCRYPKHGIGGQIGFAQRIQMYPFAGTAWALLYGYAPGIAPTHGVKLSYTGSFATGSITPDYTIMDAYLNNAPRGLLGSTEVSELLAEATMQHKASIDYVLPFGKLNCSWFSPMAYIRNFEFVPHFDASYFQTYRKEGVAMSSVGFDFTLVLGNLFWAQYDARIGFTFDYNSIVKDSGAVSSSAMSKPFHIGAVFSIDL